MMEAHDGGFSRPPLLLDHRHHCSTLHLLRNDNVNRQGSNSLPTPSHTQTSLIGKPSVWTAQLNPSRIGSSSSSVYGGSTMATTLGAGFGRVAGMRCHHHHYYHRSATSCAVTHSARSSRLIRPELRQLVQNPGTAYSQRPFSSSTGGGGKRPRFSQRLGEALRNSKVTWYQIPIGVGIGFLGLVQFYKVSSREKQERAQEEDGDRPQKRPRVRPGGPW